MCHIPLKIPLTSLFFGRFLKSNYPAYPWIELVGYPFYGTSFAGSITSLKNYNNF
jgi:hypothetical protein